MGHKLGAEWGVFLSAYGCEEDGAGEMKITCSGCGGIRLGDLVAPTGTFSTKYKINMFILCFCPTDELSATPES